MGECSGGVTFSGNGQHGADYGVTPSGTILADLTLGSGIQCDLNPNTEPNCPNATGTVRVLDVTGAAAGASSLELSQFSWMLDRTEASSARHHGTPMHYLMGEWALVSHDAGTDALAADARLLKASSKPFGRRQVADLSNLLRTSTPREPAAELALGNPQDTTPPREQVALLVATPPHDLNDRYIPMPTFHVAAGEVPFASGRGKVLVRADFGEDHQLTALDILYDTLGGVTPELALHIEKSLALERVIEKDHRVIAFALLDVGKSLALEEQLLYLPRCCGGAEPCPPGSPNCEIQ